MMESARSLIGRLRRGALAPFAILAVAASSPPADQAPVHRIVAVGDLHGDYNAWRDIALAAGLEDAKGKWAGGATVFVQCGDVVDRGPDSLKILNDLMRLQKEAPKAGGRVVTLVGNHEAMNVTDDLRYVSAGDYAAFTDGNSVKLRDQAFEANKAAIEAAYHKRDPALTSDAIKADWIGTVPLGQIEHQIAWHPGGRIGLWVIGNPAVAMIDGNIFVHGGISAAYARLSLAEINKRVAKALAAGDNKDDSILFADNGPLWYRGLAKGVVDDEALPHGVVEDPPAVISTEDELHQVLGVYGAKRMIIAHTPDLTGIKILHDGKLVRIDTGISAFYNGKVTYLEILDGKLVPHEVARSVSSAKGG
jgi:hypothetical protein